MKISEYLINPAGDGITAGNPRIVREGYDMHYRNILDKMPSNQSNIKFYNVNDNIYVHVKVPSENVDKFFYDVVLELYSNNDNYTTFNNFEIKFFSNSPSFIYTYAYIYNKNDLLINELCGKYEDEILSKKPKVRNPIKYVGYEKSTYFALRYFLNKYNDRNTVLQNASNDISDLIGSIKNNEDKKIDRAFKEKAMKREKRKQEEKENNTIKKKGSDSKNKGVSKIVPKKSTGTKMEESGVNKVVKTKGKRK